MTRFEHALSARAVLGEDFFGGWDPSDAELLNRYACPTGPTEGKITDFFGIRTSSFLHPWAVHLDNQVVDVIPIPDDSLRAETIEYYATLKSFEMAPEGAFSMAEIGASYAPWTTFAAVMGARHGRAVQLVAVEASSYLHGLIPVHMAENGVDPDAPFIRKVCGAVGRDFGTMHFPVVTSPSDNGGQVTDRAQSVDYLGRQVEHEAVSAYPLSELLPPGIVDLIHMDVQGVEHDVLSASMDSLNERVRAIFVGTHSRLIEGQLLDLFHAHGWELDRERPTKFDYVANRPSVVGWTTRDGGQYWINRQLVPA